MRRRVAVAAAAAVGTLLLAGCGQMPWEDSLRDYENAEVRDPGEVTLWNNVDMHPNIARVCADGLAFYTTTREFTAVERIPEWDGHCADAEDRVMSR